mmetsp:Transcript_4343/g.13134  ORF Transcript_4343/g.13134 Transcript_4343/m.13134 type:complete len:239 (+) Transcript_4343:92-808(+)
MCGGGFARRERRTERGVQRMRRGEGTGMAFTTLVGGRLLRPATRACGRGRGGGSATRCSVKSDKEADSVKFGEVPTEADFMGWKPPPIEEDEFAEVARVAAEAADERKGRNIVALRVARLTCITTFFLYITGGSPPQLRAIMNLVQERLKEKYNMTPSYGNPGNPQSGWLLLDYGELMINIFSDEQRKYYNPEDFWRNGERLDLTKVVSPDGLRPPSEGPEAWLFDGNDDDLDEWTLK